MSAREHVLFISGLVAVLVALSPHVSASPKHYQSFNIGARAAGLGGAYTALSQDASGAFYNPAGLSALKGRVFSLTASVYKLTISRFRDQFVIGDFKRDLKLTQFSSFPSSFGFFHNVYKGRDNQQFRTTIGISVLIPTDIRVKGKHDLSDLVFSNQKLEQGSLLQEIRSQAFWFGATVSFLAHPKVSLGVSLFYHLQLEYLYETSSQVLSQSEFLFTTREINAKISNLHLVFGLQVYPISGLRLGLSLRTQSFRIHGTGRLTVNRGRSSAEVENLRHGLRPWYKLPLKIALGIAYQKPRQFTVSADLSWNDTVQPYQPYRLSLVSEERQPSVKIKRRAVFNFNIGAEYWITSYLIVQLGFYSNFAATPPVDKDNPLAEEHTNMWGVAHGWIWVKKRYSMSFTVNYNFGFGRYRSEALDPGGASRPFVAKTSRHQLYFILGGKYAF